MPQADQDWFERAPMAYVVVDRKGRIVALNQMASALLDVDRERLGRRRLGLFLLLPERVRWRAFLERIFMHRDGDLHDTTVSPRGHRVQPIHLWARLDASGTQVLVTMVPVSDITHRRRTEDEARWQANCDPLTGLPNRNLLLDRMDQGIRKAQRSRRSLALLYLDLDHFKEVNDSLGHQAGDTLLREAGRRLQACVREVDTVARLGGDEFTVVMGDLSDLARVDVVAQQILQVLAQPFQIESERVQVSASVGIALYPGDAQAADELLHRADQAMYAAKKAGRNRCHYFTVQLQTAVQERQQQISDLHSALSECQFRLYLQPVITLATGQPCLLEALLRWQHPQQGLLLPAQFMALAEETGIIAKMGDWVFEQVAEVVGRLCASGPPSLRIGVNQSLRELCRDHDQPAWVRDLQALGLPAERLLLEINERSLIEGGLAVEQALKGRIQHGVAVALDDFGTGYASMICLERIPLDYVKIDAAVIAALPERLAAQAFVEATLVLARKLGIAVIAEGVETEAQHQYLLDVGCDCAQGYLFGAPMPAEDYRPD